MASTLVFSLLFAAGVGTLCYALYPGLMSPDALFQYLQLRTGEISNLHPPIMVHLWGTLEAYGFHGPEGPYLLAWGLYSLSVWLIATTLSLQLIPRLLIASLCFSPPIVAIMMTVWKDSLMLAFLMLAVASLMKTASRPHVLWGIALLGSVWMAAALRHNAILAIVPLIGSMLYLIPRTRGVIRLGVKTLVLTGLIAASVQHVNRQNVTSISMLPTVALWDLAAISMAENEILIPPYARKDQHMTLFGLAQLFDPITNTPLCRLVPASGRQVYCMERIPLRAGKGLPSDKVEPLAQYWLETIQHHPISYLKHRLNVTCHLLDICKAYAHKQHIGFTVSSSQPSSLQGDWYNGPSALSMNLTRFKTPKADGLDIIETLSQWRIDTVALSSWPYMALMAALTLVYLLWQRRGPRCTVAMSILMSGWLTALPLFFIAPNFQLRYMIWPIVCAIIAFCMLRRPKPKVTIEAALEQETRSQRPAAIPGAGH